MSRAFWFVAGAATSAYAIVKTRRAAEALTPDGMRDRLAGLTLGVQLLGDEVRTEAAAKEQDLRARLGLVPDGTPALGPGSRGTGRHRAAPTERAQRDRAQADAAQADAAPAHPAPADPVPDLPLQLTREGNT
jgi:hypothetical protein